MAYSTSELQYFNQKWQKLSGVASQQGINPQQIRSVYNLDLQRLQNGASYQLSSEEALAAMQSVRAGQPTTPQPPHGGGLLGFLSNAFNDVKDLTVGLTGLVEKGAEDVIHPNHLADQVSALWRNPGTAWNNVLTTAVPGAADIEKILQNVDLRTQLYQNPATTILDLVPMLSAGGRAAGAAAKIGLSEEARAAATDAAKFSPFDTSREAKDARAKAAELVPNAPRRAALTNQKGLVGLANQLMLNAPFQDATIGAYLEKYINTKSRGQLGATSVAAGRALSGAGKEAMHRIKGDEKRLIALQDKYGLKDPKTSQDLAWFMSHWTPDFRKTMADRFSPQQLDLFENASQEIKDLTMQEASKDVEKGGLSQVEDPRTGRMEFYPAESGLGRKQNAYLAAKDKGRAVVSELSKRIGTDVPLTEEAAKTTMGTFLADVLSRVTDDTKDGVFEGIKTAVGKGDFVTARNLLGQVTRRNTTLRNDPRFASVLPELARARDVLRFYTTAKNQKILTSLTRTSDAFTKAIDRNPAARFQPRVNELVEQRLENLVMEKLDGQKITPDDANFVLEQIGNKIWQGEKFEQIVGQKDWIQIKNSVLKELNAEIAKGLDPIFIYSTRAGEIPSLVSNAWDKGHIRATRSVKARTFTNPGAVYDPIVGLIRKAAEDHREAVMTEVFYGDQGVLTRWQTPQDEALKLAMQFAKAPTGRLLNEHTLNDWVNREFPVLDPHEYISSSKKEITTPGATPVRVPKEVKAALDAQLRAMQGPKGFLGVAMQRGTKLFRMSLLDFSLHYQAHIWGGGTMLLAGRATPSEIIRALPAGVGMMLQDPEQLGRFLTDKRASAPLRPFVNFLMRRAEKRGETSGLPVHLSEALPEEDPNSPLQEYRYAAGTKLGKFFDESMRKRGILHPGTTVAAIGGNMLRATAYLIGKERGGTEEAGLRFAHKVFADMDGLTAFERSVIKYAIPFYGWSRHVVKYALTLPSDNPWRVMILSQMVRQEWQDWNSGIPKKMMYLFQIGGVDPAGNATVMDVRELDPLRSLADTFTMAGFLSSLNPAFQGMLQMVGVDPLTAGPSDLYPKMTLSDFYGTEQPSRSPLKALSAAVGDYIPQAQVIDHFIGISSYTRWAKQNDPAAYRNQLYASLNIPFVPYQVNVDQILAKSEMTNYNLAKSAATQAMQDPNPNSPTWKSLLSYAYVPFHGWLVQPFALRQWAFDQAIRQGYWNGQIATLPPVNIVVPPASPKI